LGIAIIKKEWLPYAAVFVSLAGGYKLYTSGASMSSQSAFVDIQSNHCPGSRPVLKPDVFQEFPLSEKTVTSHNVAIYRFSLPKPTDILGLPIGQHISLAATPAGVEKEVVRSYTPITSDEEKGYVDFMIKSYPQGNISKHMSTLKIGDTMKFKGPKGAMVYTPNMCTHIGMIAGGTGITPMLQVVRAISRGRPLDKTKVDLIFANVKPEDILLKEDLDRLAREDANFNVYYVLNEPPAGWDGGVGFVTADMIKAKLPAPGPDMKIMVCGPPPMVAAIKKATESLGYEKARVVSKLADQVFCF
jgi:cytochrome-b5 reductase